MRHVDRTIGIVLGIVLGIAIVIGFVFFGSGKTIDAPSISGDQQQQTAPQVAPAQPQQPVAPAQP